MTQQYDRRQHGDEWPRRGRWNPSEVPAWYAELVTGLAGRLAKWRDDDRDPHRLDPRCDPRGSRLAIERRAVR